MTKVTEQVLALNTAMNDDLYGGEEYGFMCKVTETDEGIYAFLEAAPHYAESSKPTHGEIAGFPFVYFGRVQVARAHQRDEMSVVDLGDVRLVLNVNLTEYI